MKMKIKLQFLKYFNKHVTTRYFHQSVIFVIITLIKIWLIKKKSFAHSTESL